MLESCTVKIRYSHPGTPATVTPLEDNRARIRLHEPQRAVTPGQAAVIYEDDVVLGGGWICRQRGAGSRPNGWLKKFFSRSARFRTPKPRDKSRISSSRKIRGMRKYFTGDRIDLSLERENRNRKRNAGLFQAKRRSTTAFQEKLRSLHPYEVPEIIFVPVASGLPDYLRWVAESCAS